jgi:hypothetical protein
MVDVLGLAACFHMPLRITGPADAEAAGGRDLPHQLAGVAVGAGVVQESAGRQVAPQGENILDFKGAQAVKLRFDILPRGGQAGQVGQRGHAPVLHGGGNGGGMSRRAPAGAVGERSL